MTILANALTRASRALFRNPADARTEPAPAAETPASALAAPDAAAPATEGWFRSLAESTEVSILVYRDVFLYANPAAERLTGYRADELVGAPITLLIHADHQQLVIDRARRRLAGESIGGPIELKVVRRDGAVLWAQVTATLVEMDGKPAGLLSAIDVTERKLTLLALEEHRARLELAQRVARMVTWEWDLYTDRLIFVGDARPVLGGDPGGLWPTGTSFIASIHPDDQSAFAAELARCLRFGGDFFVEFRVECPDRLWRWFSERGRALRDESGGVHRLIGVSNDVTEAKHSQEELTQERELAGVTLASIGDGVLRTDAEGRVDYLNPVAERLMGWSASEAHGQPALHVLQLIDEKRRPIGFDPIATCLSEGRVVELPGRALLVRRDGIEFAVQDSVAPIFDAAGRIAGTVLVLKDVTGLRAMEREMSYLARHDALTGLLNRREFEARLDACLDTAEREGRRHGLLYLDLDEFKLVNDTAGHLAGDELLKQLSTLLLARVRPSDTLARLGGDEFGVLLEGADADHSRRLAEELRAAVRAFRFDWQERTFTVGVSIGLVPLSAGCGDRVQVLAAADAACYVAKEQGRDRIHAYQVDDQALVERYGAMQWIHRIQKAFEEERFQLFRQPIRPLAQHRREPELSEIFIRMIDEQGQLTLPGAFIPAAERYRSIQSIDRWVVRHAFTLLAERTRRGDDLRWAINLSGQSIGEESFLAEVLELVELSGVDPARVCFEVTETAAVANLARAQAFIRTLKGLGCRFVLDDFGTGLSSFAYLKNLDVDFLKIDGGFVRDVNESAIQRALVEAIHQVGQLLGLATIAESVEDQAILATLEQIGVDYVQGNGIAVPEPIT